MLVALGLVGLPVFKSMAPRRLKKEGQRFSQYRGCGCRVDLHLPSKSWAPGLTQWLEPFPCPLGAVVIMPRIVIYLECFKGVVMCCACS